MNTVMQLDYASQLDYLWALLPEAVLATGALILLLYDGFARREGRDNRAVGWGGLLFIGRPESGFRIQWRRRAGQHVASPPDFHGH